MKARDQEALKDIVGVIGRALGFPITDFNTFAQTDYLQDALITASKSWEKPSNGSAQSYASSTAICLGEGWQACVIC